MRQFTKRIFNCVQRLTRLVCNTFNISRKGLKSFLIVVLHFLKKCLKFIRRDL